MAYILTEARIRANQRNARRSTGPKTAEGKIRARANAVKHGLTGEGLALLVEDEEEVEIRFGAIQGELAPQTVLGNYFAHQMALNTVRTQRAARQETAALDRRVRRARLDFDAARAARVRRLVVKLGADPGAAYPRLRAMPEGVDRLVGELRKLRQGLTNEPIAWSTTHEARLAALQGRRVGGSPGSRAAVLARVLVGDGAAIDPREVQHLPTPAERQAWAARELTGWIDAEIERLLDHRKTLDHCAIELARIEAEDVALFDPGKDAALARKYEAAATRDLRHALRDYQVAEALGDPADSIGPLDDVEPIDQIDDADDRADGAEPPASAMGLDRKSHHRNDLRRSVGSSRSLDPTDADDALGPATNRRSVNTRSGTPGGGSGSPSLAR